MGVVLDTRTGAETEKRGADLLVTGLVGTLVMAIDVTVVSPPSVGAAPKVGRPCARADTLV